MHFFKQIQPLAAEGGKKQPVLLQSCSACLVPGYVPHLAALPSLTLSHAPPLQVEERRCHWGSAVPVTSITVGSPARAVAAVKSLVSKPRGQFLPARKRSCRSTAVAATSGWEIWGQLVPPKTTEPLPQALAQHFWTGVSWQARGFCVRSQESLLVFPGKRPQLSCPANHASR